MPREIARTERYDHGRIEVWRREEDEPWFVTVLPDQSEEGFPGHTYAREGDLPSEVPDEPDALLAWAKRCVTQGS